MVLLRDRVERLCEITSEMLSHHEYRARIEVDRWEDVAPHVVGDDGVNAEFVCRALRSHMVVALLQDEIRSGTLEELEAVLADGGIEVAVLLCVPKKRWWRPRPRSARRAQSDLMAFLERWNNWIIYRKAGPWDSDSAWDEIVRTVVDLTIRVLDDTGGGRVAYVDRY